MDEEIQIGGDYICKQCGQHCSGGIYHDCPIDKLPGDVLMIRNDIKKIESEISSKQQEIKSLNHKLVLRKKILEKITPKEKKKKVNSIFGDLLSTKTKKK